MMPPPPPELAAAAKGKGRRATPKGEKGAGRSPARARAGSTKKAAAVSTLADAPFAVGGERAELAPQVRLAPT